MNNIRSGIIMIGKKRTIDLGIIVEFIKKSGIRIWNGAINKKYHMKRNGFLIKEIIKRRAQEGHQDQVCHQQQIIIKKTASAVWRLTSTIKLRIVIIIIVLVKEEDNIKRFKVIKEQQHKYCIINIVSINKDINMEQIVFIFLNWKKVSKERRMDLIIRSKKFI